jgi:hypothetical protein
MSEQPGVHSLFLAGQLPLFIHSRTIKRRNMITAWKRLKERGKLKKENNFSFEFPAEAKRGSESCQLRTSNFRCLLISQSRKEFSLKSSDFLGHLYVRKK